MPIALKFSIAQAGIGSIRVWHEAHKGWVAMHLERLARSVGAWLVKLLSDASSAGIFGGGGGAGVPRMLLKTNSPRFTGEVRSGFEVTVEHRALRQYAAALDNRRATSRGAFRAR